jgi:hypothetical protein
MLQKNLSNFRQTVSFHHDSLSGSQHNSDPNRRNCAKKVEAGRSAAHGHVFNSYLSFSAKALARSNNRGSPIFLANFAKVDVGPCHLSSSTL